MPKIIVSGRGGSGKSTLVTLLANSLSENREVLVVDADESNLGLAAMLGMEPPEQTILGFLGGKAEVGKKLLRSIQSAGNEKVRLFEEEIKIDSLPTELMSVSGRKRLVRVGKIEHSMEGCACPMGATARAFLNLLPVEEDEWVIVDTEAGVEHFGRGVLEGADMVLMLVDPSHEAVLLAQKASILAGEAGKAFCVVVTKADEQSKLILENALSRIGLATIGSIPYSKEIASANLAGDSLYAVSGKTELDSVLSAIESSMNTP